MATINNRREINPLHIPEKANRILNILLFSLVLIFLRIWFLAVVQHEEKVEESTRPKRKTVMEPSKRGTIRDRFNIPLAINKIQYQAGIVYSELTQIPPVKWEKDKEGKLVKHFKRKEYIERLSNLLGKELNEDPKRIEDLIYSKASFYHQFPFILKEEIDEKSYYRLKMLEKDWPGIHVQCYPKRFYPKDKLASDVIGYMGAINKKEYEKIIHQISLLHDYLKEHESTDFAELPHGYKSHEEALIRLKELEANAYTINDYIGKMGIEGSFEENLRGYQGKKSFYSDSRGNFLRELPGKRTPLSGERLLLTISAELQEYAEELLAKNETFRHAHVSHKTKEILASLRDPWVKGGAIVVIDPNNGEVLTLASYPRFNPNDFITSSNPLINKEKNANINRWFENESYIAELWNQKKFLTRELFDDQKKSYYEESKKIDLKTYLDFILPVTNPVYHAFIEIKNIKTAVFIQKKVERLSSLLGTTPGYKIFNALYNGEEDTLHKNLENKEINLLIETNSKQHESEINEIKKELYPYFASLKKNYDKVLLVDLCRLFVPGNLFNETLLEEVGEMSLSSYRNISASMTIVTDLVKTRSQKIFHHQIFSKWRETFEKPYLKEKRETEKRLKKHQKPYIDYFEAEEKQQFEAFWKEHRFNLIMAFLTGSHKKSKDELTIFLDYFKKWHQEIEESQPNELSLEVQEAYFTLKEAIYPIKISLVQKFLATLKNYHDLNRPLLGNYRYLRKDSNAIQLEKHLASAFYPKTGFGYGRSQAFRQSSTQGSIFKLVTAYETLVQRYQKLDNKNLNFKEINPLEIIDNTHRHGKELSLGFFHDGTPIPRLYKGGRLLKSSSDGIGHIDLIKAIQTSSNPYFSILAGDILNSPEDLATSAKLFSYGSKTGIDLTAELSGSVPTDLSSNKTGLYAMANGQHSLIVTPLQTAVFLSSIANGGKIYKPIIVKMSVANSLEKKQNVIKETKPKLRRSIFMPDVIRGILLEGMRLVVEKQIRTNLQGLSRLYRGDKKAISDFVDLKGNLIGKTSTSESNENLNLDLDHGTNLYTHIWFGGIAFDSDFVGLSKDAILFKDGQGKAELVVVVYLKYGSYGWGAAPIAAQMVKKWREIKAKHEKKSFSIK